MREAVEYDGFDVVDFFVAMPELLADDVLDIDADDDVDEDEEDEADDGGKTGFAISDMGIRNTVFSLTIRSPESGEIPGVGEEIEEELLCRECGWC